MNYGIYNPNYGFPDSLSFGMKRLFAARPHPCYGSYLSLDPQTSKTRDIRLAVPLGIFLLKNTEKSSDQAELPALNTQNDFLEYELLVFFQSELVIHMENKLQTWFKSHEGADWAILYLRLFIGTIILLHNVGKMQAYNEIINYYPSWGIFGSAFISLRSHDRSVVRHFAHAGLQSPPVRRDHGRQSAHLAVIPLPRQRIRNLRTAVRLSGNPGSPGNFGRRSLFARRPGFGQKSEVSTNPQLFPTNRRFNKK